jgi:hypothetical protein
MYMVTPLYDAGLHLVKSSPSEFCSELLLLAEVLPACFRVCVARIVGQCDVDRCDGPDILGMDNWRAQHGYKQIWQLPHHQVMQLVYQDKGFESLRHRIVEFRRDVKAQQVI